MTPVRRQQISVIMTSLLLLGSIAVLVNLQYPLLTSTRSAIDTTRAATAAIAIQQQNLEDLQRQQATLATAATALQKEVWSFQTEDAFYAHIQSIAQKTFTTIPEPKLSDAIPNGTYQVRTGTITISGPTATLIKAIDALVADQPVISIQEISFEGGNIPHVVLTIQTTWQ